MSAADVVASLGRLLSPERLRPVVVELSPDFRGFAEAGRGGSEADPAESPDLRGEVWGDSRRFELSVVTPANFCFKSIAEGLGAT